MDADERMARLRIDGKVIFREEDMEAYLIAPSPATGTYRTSELMNFLAETGVTFGILQNGIMEIVNGTYYKEVLVAKGNPKEDGKDGWFEFLFDIKSSSEPVILEDGSVDYRTFSNFTTVKQGEEIVKYHPAVSGKNGQSVRGVPVQSYRGKEQRRISGKGFVVSEDKCTYLAAITGKIDYINDKLIITNLLEVDDDVDYISGDIEFEGDVLIRGNVASGMTITASGKVDIFGHVEGATIKAGKDVILHSGMQGNGRGSIEAGGDVSGKFFEQIEIKAKGNVSANSILSCNVDCEGSLEVTGSFGMILGGTVRAIKGVKAATIGNASYVRTSVIVGVGDEIFGQIALCEKQLKETGERIDRINNALSIIAQQEEKIAFADIKEKKVQLMRAKIAETTSMAEISHRKEQFESVLGESIRAEIIVNKKIYPGCSVTVCGATKVVNDEFKAITVKKHNGEIGLFSNY